MINLLFKDYLFNKKNIIFFAIFYLICTALFIVDKFTSNIATKDIIGFMTILPWFSSYLLMRISGMEDNDNTRYFLKSLPYSDNMRVISRYFFMFINLFAVTLYCIFIYVMFFPIQVYILQISSFAFCAILIYCSLYIALHFRYSFFAAQNCPYFIFAILVFLSFISNFAKSSRDVIFSNILDYIKLVANSPVLYIATALITVVLAIVACYGEKREKRVRVRAVRNLWKKFS
ncbi:MAG: ABC-2 transporter permease [Oscillospiraceae bacterium]|jgi:hypothetical protein|nr:ABC-2 transporter permease [Oscillospiraceae bacterium]